MGKNLNYTVDIVNRCPRGETIRKMKLRRQDRRLKIMVELIKTSLKVLVPGQRKKHNKRKKI